MQAFEIDERICTNLMEIRCSSWQYGMKASLMQFWRDCMSAKKQLAGNLPEVEWFRERTESFRGTWKRAEWHENGDRKLASLRQSIRRYASSINKLPENFLPSVLDQHLAVLSQGYEYQVLEIIEVAGGDRFVCRNTDGEAFVVYSHSIEINREEGSVSFLTALIRLDAAPDLPGTEDSPGTSDLPGTVDSPVPAITYGPILGWKSLVLADFSVLARECARDLARQKGVSAVVRRDPVPFWALWTLSETPGVVHGNEEVCTCWKEGFFSADPAPYLGGTSWKRDSIGKRVRYRKTGAKPFFEQQVIYDEKTMRGIIIARRASYLVKLASLVENVFAPDSEGEGSASIMLEIALTDIFRTKPAYQTWTAPFEREDERKQKELNARSPGRQENLAVLNTAMKDLLPYINAGSVPDWAALAKKHALSPETLDTLKALYDSMAVKLR